MTSERRYAVVALEPVWHTGFLLGHVERTFYRKQSLNGIDLETFWDDFDEDEWQFHDHWQAELFTESESEQVIGLVRRVFPTLTCVTRKTNHYAQLERPVPLRVYPNDGGYSQWDFSQYSAELGFPIAAFADYDISNVLVDEPLCKLGPESSSTSDRCAFCERKIGRCSELGVSIYTTDGEEVCRSCAETHAPQVVSRIGVAEETLGKPCRECDRLWRDHCVDRGLSDEWLEQLNSLRTFNLISICEGHITKDCDQMRAFPHISLRVKAHLRQTIADKWGRVRAAIDQHFASAIDHRSTDAGVELSLESGISRPGLRDCSDFVVKFSSRFARTESGAEPSMIQWFEETLPAVVLLDSEVKAAIEPTT